MLTSWISDFDGVPFSKMSSFILKAKVFEDVGLEKVQLQKKLWSSNGKITHDQTECALASDN